ncbi:MAG: ParB/RepB/Spo0J family partition protein [Acidobacteria bacterium]|nr:ParB/RepB/Spo0J family partition protein [Acidobacteriota bacterium]
MDTPYNKTINISSGRRGLGRGLDALLPASPGAAPSGGDTVRQIGVSTISPNPHQPRQQFHPERLQELADSIKVHGIVQPVVVRRQGEKYLLIAGERRWRAASLAGLPTVPAIIRNVPDNQILEITLIENIQREDLNPVELAEALARLSNDANLTHEQIAERTGKDRVTVTNHLRLLKLPEDVRKRVASGELSMGHAKVLMGLESAEAQKALAARIVAQGLSVRQTEAVAKEKPGRKTNFYKTIVAQAVQDPNVQAALREIERALGTRVRLIGDDLRGKIVIEYHSPDDLDRIYALLLGRK